MTTPDMLAAGENYLEENKLYDLRLVSTIGYDDEAVETLNEQDGVQIAEGGDLYGFSCGGGKR